jgi:Tol biopolymer transport system component
MDIGRKLLVVGVAGALVLTTAGTAAAAGGGRTSRVSVSSTGAQGNDHSYLSAVSADGRYVAFVSQAANLVPGDTNGTADVFVRDRRAGATTRASVSSTGAQGNGPSRFPAVNADGRYVVFGSLAANLVPGDTNGGADVFIRDRVG